MDEKIKVILPQTTLNVLKKDCVDFLILKENGKPNMNAFVNTLILNFYEAFSASEETLHQDLKNAISIVPDYYKDKVLNNVLKILTKKNAMHMPSVPKDNKRVFILTEHSFFYINFR